MNAEPAGNPGSAVVFGHQISADPYSSINGFLGTGPVFTSSINTLDVGSHIITLVARDNHSATNFAFIQLEILSSTDPACSNIPPSVTILRPQQWDVFTAMKTDSCGFYAEGVFFEANGHDPDGSDEDIQYFWYIDTMGTEPVYTGRSLVGNVCSGILSGCFDYENVVITVRAIDENGGVGEDSIVVELMGPPC